jgi:hypothetical protein
LPSSVPMTKPIDRYSTQDCTSIKAQEAAVTQTPLVESEGDSLGGRRRAGCGVPPDAARATFRGGDQPLYRDGEIPGFVRGSMARRHQQSARAGTCARAT